MLGCKVSLIILFSVICDCIIYSEMHKNGEHCDTLIMETENALSDEVVTLMLLATQRGNLERSVKNSLRR